MIFSSKLGVGPMSPQIIKSVFSYSEKNAVPLMLIASLNQINYMKGYVFSNKNYFEYTRGLKKIYPKAEVYICRDHCGPGFSSQITMDNIYASIDNDLEFGYDLIHVDFCNFSKNVNDILEISSKVINYITDKSKKIYFEIGTDENSKSTSRDPREIESLISYFKKICNPVFFVVQTGSLIKEVEQIGIFNKEYVETVNKVISKYNVIIKEHNADYLDAEEIKKRKGLIGAVNNAPQFGVCQTLFTLSRSKLYGIDSNSFLEKSYKSKCWEKWLYKNTPDNKYLCAIIAGHYNFDTKEYKTLIEKINKCENFDIELEKEIYKLINHYVRNLG